MERVGGDGMGARRARTAAGLSMIGALPTGPVTDVVAVGLAASSGLALGTLRALGGKAYGPPIPVASAEDRAGARRARMGGYKRSGWSKQLGLAVGAPVAAIIPGDSVAEAVIAGGLFNFFNLYNNLLLVRIVLTWFPGLPAPLQGPANALAGITDPYLNLFRGIIPPIGGTIDLSPILAFVTLNVFTNAAAALPAEMPKDGAAPADAKGPGRP